MYLHANNVEQNTVGFLTVILATIAQLNVNYKEAPLF